MPNSYGTRGGSYGGPRTSGAKRRRRRRNRIIKAVIAWAVCVLLIALIAVGTIRVIGSIASSKMRQFRGDGIEKLEAGDFAGAIDAFDAALEKSGDKGERFNQDVLCYRAEAEYRLEDYGAAAHTYALLLEMEPDKPEYMYAQSMCYSGIKDADNAASSYKAGLSHDNREKPAPGREKALLAAGSACVEAEQYQMAMALYEDAVKDGIKNGQIYNQMGLCKMAEKDYQGALDWFNQGYETLVTGRNLGTGADLKSALAHEDKEKPDTADLEQDKAVLRELAYNKAVAYEYLYQYQKALELFQEYVDAFGTDERAEHEIAFLKTR